MRRRRGRAAPPPDEGQQAIEAVARVRAVLVEHLARGGDRYGQVNVAQVLDLIDPRGMWSYEPQGAASGEGGERLAAPEDPLAGLGIKPVTYDGKGPPL